MPCLISDVILDEVQGTDILQDIQIGSANFGKHTGPRFPPQYSHLAQNADMLGTLQVVLSRKSCAFHQSCDCEILVLEQPAP